MDTYREVSKENEYYTGCTLNASLFLSPRGFIFTHLFLILVKIVHKYIIFVIEELDKINVHNDRYKNRDRDEQFERLMQFQKIFFKPLSIH